jgi:branched-chain amino acid transport system permease protein
MARRRKRMDRGIRVRSESMYALLSPRELLYLSGPRLLFIAAFLLLPMVLAPVPYWQRVALSACLYGLLALSFDFLANYAGLVCLGGAFFYGVGGYATAILNTQLALPPLLSIPLATVLGALVCTLALAPCLSLRGIYFAVVTLMYPLLMVRLIEAADIVGGTEGLRGLQGFGSSWVESWGLIGALLVAVFALRRLATESPGLVIRAVKDNDQAVRAAGIDVAWTRARALFLAALLGCLAGAWYAHMYKSVGVSAFALDLSILPIAFTIVGGGGNLFGAVLGSAILYPLGEALRDFGSLRIMVYALVLTAFVVLRSEGILPWLARKYHQFETWVEV